MHNFRSLRVGGLMLKETLLKNVCASFKSLNHHPYSITPGKGPPLPGEQPTPPSRKPNQPPRKFPELLYFPKLFRWLGMKIKLKYLQKAWDPEFTEGAFIYGSTRAICKISEIIHNDKPDELKGLLTEEAEKQLRADMLGKLTNLQKKVILLTPDDIKLLVPIKVELQKDKEDKKRCMVMLKTLSMKWYQENQNVKLVLIVIDTAFTREYVQSNKSEWIISLFRIVQCALINGSPIPPRPPPPPPHPPTS